MNLRATAKRARNLRQCLFQLNDSKIIRDVIFPDLPRPPRLARAVARADARAKITHALLALRTAPSRVARASSPTKRFPAPARFQIRTLAPSFARPSPRARASIDAVALARASRIFSFTHRWSFASSKGSASGRGDMFASAGVEF